jgi:hypothetical protein
MEAKSKSITINVPETGLTNAQLRLLKTFYTTLMQAITTDDEAEFFEGSAAIMRLCAALIQQANFTEKTQKSSSIPYAEQALEYSLDILQEHMNNRKVVNYDN